MINLIKKRLLTIFIFISFIVLFGFSSSSYLISQSAFYSHDYTGTLLNYDNEKLPSNLNDNLLDKIIAAIITEDLPLANNIAKNILLNEKENQEAYIVQLSFLYYSNKIDKFLKLSKEYRYKNELIDFIFFDNGNLKDHNTVSNSLIEIVVSSYSNAKSRSLNYDFLLFYISLAKLIDPTNDRAALIKGELFQNIKKIELARNIFENIDSNSPYYVEAQKSLAYNYSTFLPFEEAVKKINILLEKTNNNYFIKKVLADFYRYQKKYELSISVYDELIKENKDDLWNMHYMRGICYERLDNWTEAEKDFLKSLEINPNSPNVLNYLAYGWVERDKQLEKSLKMLEVAYKENPESFYIIDSLAWAHFKMNNLEEAARLMEMVIDMAPGEAISLDHLGDIYYAMNRKREAIHFWQQALELAEPEDEIEKDVQVKLDKFNAG